ncbi:hypothetical protein ACFY2W_17045 [Streptomyces sp. NPDC001262]|uniref:hypothetical protein n=1 Tax=Streptomyces sp. NPDC001262 TaxID=3364552 RepID=UPI0036B0CD2B
MTRRWTARGERRQRDSGGAKVKSGALFAIALFALSACASPDRAVGSKELRKLGNSSQAAQARQREEKHLRRVAQAYADRNHLSLGLVVVHDICEPGSGPGWFFQQETNDYKVACSMSITAYYGADLKRMNDVLDGPLTVDRGQGADDPGTADPGQEVYYGQKLTWNTVHDTDSGHLVEDPYRGLSNDPPVSRVVREPASTTVAGIRKQYGMVFELELNSGDYYKVFKPGKAPGH